MNDTQKKVLITGGIIYIGYKMATIGYWPHPGFGFVGKFMKGLPLLPTKPMGIYDPRTQTFKPVKTFNRITGKATF